MLDCRHAHVAALNHCTAVSLGDILCHGIDYRLVRHIATLYLVSVVLRSREEGGLDVESGMQAFSFDRKFAAKGDLFHQNMLFYLFSELRVCDSSSFFTRSKISPRRLRYTFMRA